MHFDLESYTSYFCLLLSTVTPTDDAGVTSGTTQSQMSQGASHGIYLLNESDPNASAPGESDLFEDYDVEGPEEKSPEEKGTEEKSPEEKGTEEKGPEEEDETGTDDFDTDGTDDSGTDGTSYFDKNNFSWPDKYEVEKAGRVISSTSDPFPGFAYGQRDEFGFLTLSPAYIEACFLYLRYFKKKMNLPKVFLDFLDDLEFDDIAIVCSASRENIESHQAIISNQTFKAAEDEWKTVIDLAEKFETSEDLKALFFAVLQLTQHAKRFASLQRNDGSYNFWPCASKEAQIQSFFNNCKEELYPFYGRLQFVDEDIYLMNKKQLKDLYYKGYEQLRELLEGEEPFLQLSSQTNLTPIQIKQFADQLRDHCKNQHNLFTENEDWAEEKFMFAQQVLQSLRNMNLSDAENTITDIYNCLRIRNALHLFDFKTASQKEGNCYWPHKEMLPQDVEQYNKKIAPAMERVAIGLIEMMNVSNSLLRATNFATALHYIEKAAERFLDMHQHNKFPTLIMDDILTDFAQNDTYNKIRKDMCMIADFSLTCYFDIGLLVINEIAYLVFKDIALVQFDCVKEDGSPYLALNFSRFVEHKNVKELRMFVELSKLFIEDYEKGNDQEKINSATKFKNALKVIQNLTDEKTFERPWKNVENCYKKSKLSDSNLSTDVSQNNLFLVYSKKIVQLAKTDSLNELMLLDFIKARLFSLTKAIDDAQKSKSVNSLLKSKSTALTTTTGDTGATNIMPEVRRHHLPIKEKLLAEPFKRVFTEKFNTEQVKEWEEEIDNSSLQKISTHFITDPQRGDVYIFECDVAIKDAKECDGYLWISDGGGERHKTVTDIKRMYFRAMDMDGKKTKTTKTAYHFFKRKPQVIMFLYRDGVDGCLKIGTVLNKHKTKSDRKRKMPSPSSSNEDDAEEQIDDPTTKDPMDARETEIVEVEEDFDPSTIPDSVFATGLFKLPATPVDAGVHPNRSWRIKDALAAFSYAEEKNLFQVIFKLAYAYISGRSIFNHRYYQIIHVTFLDYFNCFNLKTVCLSHNIPSFYYDLKSKMITRKTD